MELQGRFKAAHADGMAAIVRKDLAALNDAIRRQKEVIIQKLRLVREQLERIDQHDARSALECLKLVPEGAASYRLDVLTEHRRP